MISGFVSNLCKKQRLTKYEQYQLAYYQTILQSIEKPTCFLTNKREIEIYQQLYALWGIAANIENTSGNLKQAVLLFSFLSNYKITSEQDLFSSFLTFFGIIVGLEAIYNLTVSLFQKNTSLFNQLFIVLVLIVIAVYSCVLIRKTIKKHRENVVFRNKTREENHNQKTF